MTTTWQIAVHQAGGVRGAFGVGSLAVALNGLRGQGFDAHFGTSTGALTAAWMGQARSGGAEQEQYRRRLEQLYLEEITGNSAVVNVPFPGGLLGKARGLGEAGGIYRFEPLAKLLRKHLDFSCYLNTAVHTEVGVVQLENGAFQSLSPRMVLPAQWPSYVLASCAAPLMAGAIEIDGKHYVDGGVREITPIAPALRWLRTLPQEDAAILHVFCTGPLAPKPKTLRSGLDALTRALALHSNAVMSKDLNRVLRENAAILDGRGQSGHRVVTVRVYEPESYGPEAYDFNPTAIRAMIEEGKATVPWSGILPGARAYVNEYFNHPDHILGRVAYTGSMDRRDDLTIGGLG